MKAHHPASSVFMVHPTSFGFDDQTAQTNTFQQRLDTDANAITSQAQAEFVAAIAKLRRRGIRVIAHRDRSSRPKPNAVFPNNWITTWPDGRVVLYPMATESRRRERTRAALAALRRRFRVADTVDLTAAEQTGVYLEGTGVIIFDHVHGIAYASVSPRCDEQLCAQHARELGYAPIIFHAYAQNEPVYHTNVLMGVQTNTAVICTESIADPGERDRVISSLEQTGHQVVDITIDQMMRFCGNIIELENTQGQRFLVMSQTAYDAFTPGQRAMLGHDKTLLALEIPTIEAIGGGSARCMIAEIFLPRAE
jgi:hypothetical protein